MEMWANIGCKIRVWGSVASKIEACSVCGEGFWWAKGALGDPWGHLGCIWGPLGSFGDPWGPFGGPWGLLGAPLEALETSLGGPGVSLGGTRGHLGPILEAFGIPNGVQKLTKK